MKRDNVDVHISGDTISVITITGELDIRIDSPESPPIELDKVTRLDLRPGRFELLFFTNEAQPGRFALLYIGREASFEAVPIKTGLTGILDRAENRINPATEETLTALLTTLSSILSRNIAQVGGTPQTPRDWPLDLAKLQNLDVLLSTRASEATLGLIKAKTDNLDVLLSSRASEATLTALRDLLKPILKGSVFNTAFEAGVDIFAAGLTPTNSPTIFRIYAVFNAAGVLSVARTRAGTTVLEQLNGGINLNANAAYLFDVPVETGDSINLRYSVAATALRVLVMEVPAAA